MVRLNAGGVFATIRAPNAWRSLQRALESVGPRLGRVGPELPHRWRRPRRHLVGLPGAVFAPSEGARKTTVSVSPGSYQKFCGLEIVKSPHFPADWQGNAITCDFRAHRVVRFAIDDLSGGMKPRREKERRAEGRGDAWCPSPLLRRFAPSGSKSGYVTRSCPTSSAPRRQLPPHRRPPRPGRCALHRRLEQPGDQPRRSRFPRPRRDKERGRIWRITKKDTPVVKWEPLVGKKNVGADFELRSKKRGGKAKSRRIRRESPADRRIEVKFGRKRQSSGELVPKVLA